MLSGTAGQCDGTLSQDLNALWCATCPKPGSNPGAGTTAQVQAWFRGIAKNRLMESLRRRRQHSRLVSLRADILDRIPDPYEHINDSDDRPAHLRACLEQLPERSRHLLRDRYIEQFAVGDIAERLGRSVNAVSLMLHRLKRKLQDCLARSASGALR